MADGVLPPLLILSVIREELSYPVVDLIQGEPLRRRLLDGHADERYVGIRRFGVA